MSTASPLLQDVPFSLLAGGLHRCDPSWNKPADGIDRCYKLYLPIRGQARLILQTQQVRLRPGTAYLIPGYRLVRQECPRRMDVYWVHFVPESMYLTFLLSHLKRVYQCPQALLEYWMATFTEIPCLFGHGARLLFYRVQAMLMDVVSEALESYRLEQTVTAAPAFERLRPAIEFMDRRLLENPPLAEIAKWVHLAPNYFHRRFTATFHVTPFEYMLRRRLNLGRQLLLSTDLTLDRIAERCGFYGAFHFSKLFKKRCGLSPKELRRRALP